MKKILLITAALAIAVTAAGCGKKDKKTGDPVTDYGVNATENVDMNKISGDELTAAPSNGVKESGAIGKYEVGIDKAKVIDYNDEKVVIVSFDFKNNSSQEANFAGAMTVTIEQDGADLRPVNLNEVEGYDIASVAQMVKKGEKITVQRAYALSDDKTAVNVTVKAFNSESNEGSVAKIFEIK